MSLPVLLRDVFRAKREASIHSLLNLWAIEDGVLVGVDLQFTKVYRLTCPDTLFASSAEVQQHAVALGRLLDALPPNCTAQLIASVRWDGGRQLEEYAAAERPDDEAVRSIVSERVDFLKTLPFRTVEHFLAITTHPSAPDLSSMRVRPYAMKAPPRTGNTEAGTPNLGGWTPTPAGGTTALAAQHAHRLEEIKAVCNSVLGALRDAKVAAAPLSEEELVSFLYKRLNPATATHTEAPEVRPGLTLRGQVALNACDNRFDAATIDGYHHRGVNLHVRPTALDGRDMHALLNQIPGDFDLVVAVHSTSQDAAEKALKADAATAFTLGSVHVTRYHEAHLRTQDADDLAAYAKAEFQKLFLASCHVVLRAVDATELTRHTDQAIEAFRRLEDSVAVVDDMNHLSLFLASLPGHSHLNPRTHLVPTEVAARFLTMSASWNGTPRPQVVFPCDDGKLLGLDLFSAEELTAKHSLILGVSGEGKSVLTNTLLESFYCASPENHVICIDDGGSYRRPCEGVRGQYLEPTLDGKYSFNPLLPRQYAFDEGRQLDADFLSFITLLVQLMVRRPDLTNNEKSIIARCVHAAYSKEVPLLGDLRAAFKAFAGDAEDVARARTFYKDLELWTEGTYGRLLNRPSTFNADSRFIVFDLNRMTQDDLKPVVLLIIKSVIYPKLANKRLRKIIALDEVWKFLREKAGADLVTEWYKTGRRFNASVSVITQSVEDLLNSAAAGAIAENSTVKLIFNLGGGYDKLHQLKLSPEDIEQIRALAKNPDRTLYRKIFFAFGARRAIVRNYLSPTAYWRYTTDPQDLRCVQELQAKEPAWSAFKVFETLGGLRREHRQWRTEDYLRAIAAGRY